MTSETRDWAAFYGSLDEENLRAIALLRVIECTNGCIQHAFRDNNPVALSVEETREAMRYSMTAMKELAFQVGEQSFSFEGEVAEGLREARELYVRAFKQGDESAMDEFFDCSIACVRELGEQRILDAVSLVKSNLAATYPERTVDWGLAYLLRLLSE